MNRKQKICLLAGIILFAVLGLFPRCWVSAGPGTNPLPRRWFILNNSKAFVIRDRTYFYVQQAVICIATVGLVLVLRDKKPKIAEGNKYIDTHNGVVKKREKFFILKVKVIFRMLCGNYCINS